MSTEYPCPDWCREAESRPNHEGEAEAGATTRPMRLGHTGGRTTSGARWKSSYSAGLANPGWSLPVIISVGGSISDRRSVRSSRCSEIEMTALRSIRRLARFTLSRTSSTASGSRARVCGESNFSETPESTGSMGPRTRTRRAGDTSGVVHCGTERPPVFPGSMKLRHDAGTHQSSVDVDNWDGHCAAHVESASRPACNS